MLNIVAIGGGYIGKWETLSIDRSIVRLTGKKHPNALFVPTASEDALDYWHHFQRLYQGRLHCQTDALFLVRENPSFETIRDKIEWADMVYVGGGNTRKMMIKWRELGVDRLLTEAAQNGKVMSGLSAGAICWFRHGNSDAPILEGRTDCLTMRVEGLGLVEATLCPHMKNEEFRLSEFTEMMKTTPGIGIGLDDYLAIQIQGDHYRILASAEEVVLHRIYWKEEGLNHERLAPHADFRPLKDLIINV